MVVLAPFVLLLATQTSPAPAVQLSSTYDQASCADQDLDGTESIADGRDEVECTEPMTPIPAVVDCASVWVRDMIGSCDLPRRGPNDRVLAIRARADVSNRMCIGFSCGHSSVPLRGAPPPSGDEPIVLQHQHIWIVLVSSPLAPQADGPALLELPFRLERPPRV